MKVNNIKPINNNIKKLAVAVPFALSVLTGCGKVHSDKFESCSKNNVECCGCKCNEENDSSVSLFRKILAGAIAAIPLFFIVDTILYDHENRHRKYMNL